MQKRKARLHRKTKETDILVDLDIDGTGRTSVGTGMPFLDHMLDLMGKHSLMNIKIVATGDLAVDCHHTVEDIGLVLGQALDNALASRKGIERYGFSLVPMDEALSRVAVDLGGRAYCALRMKCRKRKAGDFDVGLIGEFFRAFCSTARMNLHIDQIDGAEAHHSYESVFKGLGRALKTACSFDRRSKGIPSTKGVL